jgi:hypothetical protein
VPAGTETHNNGKKQTEDLTMTTLAMPKPHGDRGMEGMVAKWYAANTAEVINEYQNLAKRIANELPLGSSVLEVAPGRATFASNWPGWDLTRSPDSTSARPL